MRLESAALRRGLAAILLAGSFAGCGTASETSSPATFHQVLTGLREAASSNRVYGEIERVDELPKTQRAIVQALCDATWQLAINKELGLLARENYMSFRVRIRARALQGYTNVGLREGMQELRSVIDLESYDREANGRYKRACNV